MYFLYCCLHYTLEVQLVRKRHIFEPVGTRLAHVVGAIDFKILHICIFSFIFVGFITLKSPKCRGSGLFFHGHAEVNVTIAQYGGMRSTDWV